MSRRFYERKFSYSEARRRFEAGETITAIARSYDVNWKTVKRAIDPVWALSFDAAASAWIRNGTCPDCGGPASRAGKQSRCRPCSALATGSTARAGELKCTTCHAWKPDEDFPSNRTAKYARRGRHGQCRECLTEAKRAYRERNRVPCSHGCGTLVDAKNRRDPSKPFECRPCSVRRIHAERIAA